jgi:PAS domain S-box-containing protein
MNRLTPTPLQFTPDAADYGPWLANHALAELARADPRLVFVLDQDLNRYLYLDGPSERFFGVTHERLLADVDAWQAALDPNDRAAFPELLRQLATDGRAHRIFRVCGADGTPRSLRWSMVKQQHLGRSVIAGSIQEIGGASCAGCQLKALQWAAELAHGGLAVTGADLRFDFVNLEILALFGYPSAADLIGKSWRELHTAEEGERLDHVVLPQLRAIGQWRGRTRARRKDDTPFHLALSLSLLPNGGVVASCEDVSEQVALEERLRAAETMFRVFLNELPTAVTIRNLTGEYEFVNTSTSDFLGQEFKPGGGRRGMEVCLTADPSFASWGVVDLRVARTGEPTRFDFPIHWGGRDWVLDVKKMPLRIGSAAVSHVCTLINDVTELRKLESERMEATRRSHAFHEMQREFISMVSHEFRTPLTAIQGVHYLLAKKAGLLPAADAADFSRLLGLQDRALGTLKELVDQVLLLNRIEHMSTDTSPELVPLEEFIRRIVETFNFSLPQARVQVAFDLPEGYTAAFNESQLRAALENLISNGLKYSPDTQPVQVTVKTRDEQWTVEVVDRGRGIPPQDQAKLFQPFHRASNVGQVPGTGLGLTIVRRVVDFHRGTLAFTSETGVGTTFTLTFPRENSAGAPPASVPATPTTVLPFATTNTLLR